MLKYKLNPKLLVNIVESKQKKKIDNYVSFALEVERYKLNTLWQNTF